MTAETLFRTRVLAVLAGRRLTQHWLAAQLGTSQNTVSQWLSGARAIRLSDADLIARVLEIDLARLVEPDDSLLTGTG